MVNVGLDLGQSMLSPLLSAILIMLFKSSSSQSVTANTILSIQYTVHNNKLFISACCINFIDHSFLSLIYFTDLAV